MKWSDRIAQGSNPGFDGEKRALKAPPTPHLRGAIRTEHIETIPTPQSNQQTLSRTRTRTMCLRSGTRPYARPVKSIRRALYTPFGRHFQGGFRATHNPGPKAFGPGLLCIAASDFAPSPPLATSDKSRQNSDTSLRAHALLAPTRLSSARYRKRTSRSSSLPITVQYSRRRLSAPGR